MEIDIPMFWDYMAQLLSHPVSDPSLIPLSLVTSLMPATLVENGKVGVLAAKVRSQAGRPSCTSLLTGGCDSTGDETVERGSV